MLVVILLSGCAEQAQENGYASAEDVHYIKINGGPSDWSGDGIIDGIAVYIFFKDKDRKTIHLSGNVEFFIDLKIYDDGRLLYEFNYPFYGTKVLASMGVTINYRDLDSTGDTVIADVSITLGNNSWCDKATIPLK